MTNFYHKISDKRLEINKPNDGFVSSSDLANEFGYDVNHISLLARQGKVDGIKRNGFWFVRKASLVQYKNKIEQSRRNISTPAAAKDFAALSNAPSHQAFAPTAKRLRAPILAMVALLIGASILSAFDNPTELRTESGLANMANRDLNAYAEILSRFENHKNKFVERINYLSDKVYFVFSDFGESEVEDKATILSKTGTALLNNVAEAGEVSIFITGEIIPVEEIQRIERIVNETVNRVEVIETRVSNIPTQPGDVSVTEVTNVTEVTEIIEQIIDDTELIRINQKLLDLEEGLSKIPPPLEGGGGGTIIQTLNPDILNAGQVNVDSDLRLDGATISTITSNLTIDSNGGTTTINDNVSITGDLTISGSCTGCGGGGSVSSNSLDFDEFVDSMTLDANLTVASGSFTVNWEPHFASNIKPSTGAQYTLGDSTRRWNQLYTASGSFSDNGAGSIHIGSSAKEAVIDFDTTGYASPSLAFYVNELGSVDLIITNDDYIGIGTSIPRTLSEVVDPNTTSSRGTFDILHKALVITADNDGTDFSWAFDTRFGDQLFIYKQGSLRATFEQTSGFGFSGPLNAGNPQARATASYSRFGTDNTEHTNYMTQPEDLLISGDLEVHGSLSFGNNTGGNSEASLYIDTSVQKVIHIRSSDGDGTQQMWTNTTAGQDWSIYTVGTAGVTSLQAELGSFAFVDSTDNVTRMALTRNGYLGVGTGNPVTVLEAQGTASASYGLFGALQVAGFSSTSYSRFGTGTSVWSNIDSADDLFVSGYLEVGTGASLSGTLFVGVASNSGGGNFALCHDIDGVASSGHRIVDCEPAPGSDYQEMYPVNEDVEWGDIVVPDTERSVFTKAGDVLAKLKRSTLSYQTSIVGAAANPEDSSDFNTIGYNINSSDNPYPIALAGRVMTKVNLENGPISVGDRITTSSTPGIGMKATNSGMVVGIALEALDEIVPGTYQRIMVFINPHWYGGDNPLSESLIDDELDEGVIFDLDILFSNIVKKFYQVFNIVFSEGSIETENIKANKNLCVGSICINESDLQNLIDNGQISPPSVTPSPTPTPNPTPTPSNSPTPSPEATPIPTPSISPTPEPTPTPNPTPEPTPEIPSTPEPTPELTPKPDENEN